MKRQKTPTDRIIKVKRAAHMLGISVPTIYRWEQQGRLPIEKVRIGPNSVGFRLSDVQRWIAGEVEVV